MGHTQQRPILITGAGRRIGLALAITFSIFAIRLSSVTARNIPPLKGYEMPEQSAFRRISPQMKVFSPSRTK